METPEVKRDGNVVSTLVMIPGEKPIQAVIECRVDEGMLTEQFYDEIVRDLQAAAMAIMDQRSIGVVLPANTTVRMLVPDDVAERLAELERCVAELEVRCD